MLFWSWLAGVLTLINPCVLPLLPIVIATAFQRGRFGPLALAAGLTLSFTGIGFGVAAFGHLIGIDDQAVNRAAALMMIAFGVVLLVPRAQAALAALTMPLASSAHRQIDRVQDMGLAGQFAIGALLGAVWSPCVGPTLGGAIGLAASGAGLAQAAATMLFFGIGVSTVMLALAYGSRSVVGARRARLAAMLPWAKPLMGGALLVVGLALLFHLERHVEGWLLQRLPAWLVDLSVRI
jgi:cytochrome c-type biogenesis protein